MAVDKDDKGARNMKGGSMEMCRTFWHLCRGYWNSEQKWKVRGMLLVVIVLQLGAVVMLVGLNSWFNEFYAAIQDYDQTAVVPLVGKFTALAFVYILFYVYAIYLQQMLQIKWRDWMTTQYLGRWMQHKTYYRMQVLGGDETDNPDQRISEDINQFVMLTLQLLVGSLEKITTLVVFCVVLWNLSGVLVIPIGDSSITIPGYMVWLCLLYAMVGTYLAHCTGRRLIGLNFNQQRFEADFRFNMMRVRENGESIAFYGGETPEMLGFKERFSCVVKNFWGIMRQNGFLNFYIGSYSRISHLMPILLAAPRYFRRELNFGGFMQVVQAFSQVEDALSYFIQIYNDIAKFAAVIRRLGTFTEHMEAVEALPNDVVRQGTANGNLLLDGVQVRLPDGRVLLQDCSLDLPAGSYILITGPSGCGKSTLLRTIAGIWPFGQGTLKMPEAGRVLFLPQRPYLPLGSLRRAVYYPLPVSEDSSERLYEAMRLVDMEKFIDKLDAVDDWSRILSLGEQQRIAFARVLLVKPQWVFLDESTSALDEPREKAMYELLKKELPDTSVISVGHRSTLFAQHAQELHLAGNGEWLLRPILAAVPGNKGGF